MKRCIEVLGLVALAAGFASCVHLEVTPLEGAAAAASAAKVAPNAVRVFVRGKADPEPFIRVARLDARGTRSEIVDALREKAGSLGANAIILEKVFRRSQRDLAGGGETFDPEPVYTCIAVRYPGAPAAADGSGVR